MLQHCNCPIINYKIVVRKKLIRAFQSLCALEPRVNHFAYAYLSCIANYPNSCYVVGVCVLFQSIEKYYYFVITSKSVFSAFDE